MRSVDFRMSCVTTDKHPSVVARKRCSPVGGAHGEVPKAYATRLIGEGFRLDVLELAGICGRGHVSGQNAYQMLGPS